MNFLPNDPPRTGKPVISFVFRQANNNGTAATITLSISVDQLLRLSTSVNAELARIAAANEIIAEHTGIAAGVGLALLVPRLVSYTGTSFRPARASRGSALVVEIEYLGVDGTLDHEKSELFLRNDLGIDGRDVAFTRDADVSIDEDSAFEIQEFYDHTDLLSRLLFGQFSTEDAETEEGLELLRQFMRSARSSAFWVVWELYAVNSLRLRENPENEATKGRLLLESLCSRADQEKIEIWIVRRRSELITTSRIVSFIELPVPNIPNPAPNDPISTLLTMIQNLQYKVDYTPTSLEFYDNVHGNYQKIKGLYETGVMVNFSQVPFAEFLRSKVTYCPDLNMFTASLCVMALFEAYDLGSIAVDTTSVGNAVDALAKFHDHNSPANQPISVFWTQVLQKNGYWITQPFNETKMEYIDEAIGVVVKKILTYWGLEKSIWPLIEGYFTIDFKFDRVCPDSDDTSLNISVGSVLHAHQSIPGVALIYNKWAVQNQNLNAFAAALKKYAYRPFSSDLNANSTDPRTYFIYRDYIRSKIGDSTFGIFNVWLMNLTDQHTDTNHMEFNVNRQDMVVNVDIMQAIVNALVEFPEDKTWFDTDLQSLFKHSGDLIVWCITSGTIVARPDLTIGYYPCFFIFYWWAARLVNYITKNSTSLSGFPIATEFASLVGTALSTVGYQQVLDKLANSSDPTYAYWEVFLGLQDIPSHSDDRLFSTAAATNALIDIFVAPGSPVFKSGTPQNVIDVIAKASKWLVDNYATATAEQGLYSQTQTSDDLFAAAFPANYQKYFNGQPVPPADNQDPLTNEAVVAVSGLIDEDVYQQELQQQHFGSSAPVTYQGLNPHSFSFFSSVPYTYCAVLLVFAKLTKLNLMPSL